MRFIAKILPGSLPWRQWRKRGCISGVVDSISFRWYHSDYVSEPIDDPAVIARLRGNPVIILEAAGFVPDYPVIPNFMPALNPAPPLPPASAAAGPVMLPVPRHFNNAKPGKRGRRGV